ncbi:MAG TPA: HAD family phosphatase [Verrucomicrobiae bacterium]|nr:HAD family phosphatase [Verrucomicrobiae bacterium]
MIKAVIFDMNGVIIDDEQFHREAWRRYCKRHGFRLTEDDFKHHVFGTTEKDTFQFLYGRSLSDAEVESFSNERVDEVIELVKSRATVPPGLKDLIEDITSAGMKLGIATSARRRYFNFVMDQLKLREYFSAVLTAQDVHKGKPDPEIYVGCAKRLQVDPRECVVIEDTISGIKSGQAADMKVIAITTTHPKDELTIADLIVSSFKELSIERIENLI